ncbi:UvrB/UvrC motif-containing protein [Acetonema longum]|uniref:UvrB/UvrC protein n=1 Tax=Acetonema longum DSM 6540 TaxID=1009370 RepID=F7NM72_9FIRM|nr:UvrB/UvrC motif-containing protein [Acetonema longum]EGO62873.1 UvrB/UvrC protein [Acetonema longum DSM 6540]
MLCDDCKKRPACVHITKIVNNQKVEKHLCEQCAQNAGELQFALDSSFSVHDFLKGMFTHGMIDGGSPAVKNEIACPNCGMTYSDFSQNGKIGCSVCYTTYADRLERLLRRVHGASAHTGKVPCRTGGALVARQKIKQLKKTLEQLVAREEYEQAAKVRDEIKGLERNMSEGGK